MKPTPFQVKPSAPNDQISLPRVSVVGAGLAGSECALQLANWGYQVDLYEMRGVQSTPAHQTDQCGELVCSNSFGSLGDISAPGQLKWEAECLQSHILSIAHETKVPAGQALGVDRHVFAQKITETIQAHPNIHLNRQIISSLSELPRKNADGSPRPAVIATGPLTHEPLAKSLGEHFGDEFLYFFDAIAPIVDADTINTEIAWKADRYDKGSADYWNCPMEKEQYYQFIDEVIKAKKIEPKHFETTQFFEGCMPIEVMAERGPDTLSFGPMKPVGLRNPRTGREPWAVVQLRQDNKEGTAFNLVGFQTRMAYGEQVRVFKTIPGLENAEFLKLGSIHRNMYINSPTRLNRDLSSKNDPWLFFAGQITGVEGYFESTCIGLLVAHFIDQKVHAEPLNTPPRDSAMGSLLEAITDPTRAENFQPTNINFGLLPPLDLYRENGKIFKNKALKKEKQIERARTAFLNWRTHRLIGNITTQALGSGSDNLGTKVLPTTSLINPV